MDHTDFLAHAEIIELDRPHPKTDQTQALLYARNLTRTLEPRSPLALALAQWADEYRASLSLPGGGANFAPLTPGRPLTQAAWQRLCAALTRAAARAAGAGPDFVDQWGQALAPLLGLDPTDLAILGLALRYRHNALPVMALVDRIATAGGARADVTRHPPTLSRLLDVPADAIAARLRAASPLPASGLLRIDLDHSLNPLPILRTLTRGTPPDADPIDQLLAPPRPPSLAWAAFAHLGEAADIAASLLRAALAGREPAIHILLHGPVGTGKTSFAATLAAHVGADLRPVAEQDEDGNDPSRNDRLSGLRLAQRLAPPGRSVLLFDEAEDLFAPRDREDEYSHRGSRAYLHRLLEGGNTPVIWTANDIGAFGPAVLRRMTLCLELKIPALPVRAALWHSLAAAEGVALPLPAARSLAKLYPAAPALAATALRATRLAGGNAATAETILRGLTHAVTGHTQVPDPAPPIAFDPALINADADIPALLARLAAADAPRAVSLLLSGPPGTGKSALARHIAEAMGLDILACRASDLLSPYIGGTEANIAHAFATARADNLFLLLDEADSFLFDRATASRVWEISQVNELLTAIAHHTGPVAVTTNLPDRLDHAALRRFLVKLRLTYLTPPQSRRAWQGFFKSQPPAALDALPTLTAADFAQTHRAAALTDANDSWRLERLRAESEGRVGGERRMGF